MVAIGDEFDGDGRTKVLDFARPNVALYVGGMGARDKNFYNAIAQQYGYVDEATEIQDLYLDGKKAEAAAAVPVRPPGEHQPRRAEELHQGAHRRLQGGRRHARCRSTPSAATRSRRSRPSASSCRDDPARLRARGAVAAPRRAPRHLRRRGRPRARRHVRRRRTRTCSACALESRSSPVEAASSNTWNGKTCSTFEVTGTTVITPRPSRTQSAFAPSLLTTTAGRRLFASAPRVGSRSTRRISPRRIR